MKKFTRAIVCGLLAVMFILTMTACGGKIQGQFKADQVRVSMGNMNVSVKLDNLQGLLNLAEVGGAELDEEQAAMIQTAFAALSNMSLEFNGKELTLNVELEGMTVSETFSYKMEGDEIVVLDADGNPAPIIPGAASGAAGMEDLTVTLIYNKTDDEIEMRFNNVPGTDSAAGTMNMALVFIKV